MSFREAEGLVTLRCKVHPGSSEAEARILVIGHPFFTTTHDDGRFELRGVPAERVRLATELGGRPGPTQAVNVVAGRETKVILDPGAATALAPDSRSALDP